MSRMESQAKKATADAFVKISARGLFCAVREGPLSRTEVGAFEDE